MALYQNSTAKNTVKFLKICRKLDSSLSQEVFKKHLKSLCPLIMHDKKLSKIENFFIFLTTNKGVIKNVTEINLNTAKCN